MLIRIDSLRYGHRIYDLDDGRLETTADMITGYYSAEAFLCDLEHVLNIDHVRVYRVDIDEKQL